MIATISSASNRPSASLEMRRTVRACSPTKACPPIVDLARSKGYVKRSGGVRTIEFIDDKVSPVQRQDQDLEALDDALKALEAIDPRRSQVVELRFFGGLDVDQTAEVLKVSRRTVLRDWALARAWLFRELGRH